jgi:hypothetical protein
VARTSCQRLRLRLNGGLGNQLFEYAAGLYYSERLSIPLEIVRPHIKLNGPRVAFPRPFQLDRFSITESITPATAVDRLLSSPRPQLLRGRDAVSRLYRARIVEEPGIYSFFPDLLDDVTAATIHLIGYWQASAYAAAVEAKLRRSLVLTSEPGETNVRYADAIRALECPVSVHIRGGDYASHAAVSWVLMPEYYAAAVAKMQDKYPRASFVVFSDDPEVARQVMSTTEVGLWVNGNDTANAYEDLRLMSICKHHIIANSSFSWWGAWLNRAPVKTVIAPRYWLNSYDSYFPALCPPTWDVVDNLP